MDEAEDNVFFMQQTMNDQLTHVLSFLNQDVLKNIVLLKMLHAYPAAIQCHYTKSAEGAGVLLLQQTTAFAFDRHTYPTTQYVVLLSTQGQGAVQALLPFIPTDCNLVFKLNNPADGQVLAPLFPWVQVNAFWSYTAPGEGQFVPVAGVQIADQVDEACLALYVAQGHARADVLHYFATQQALSFTRYAEGKPLASCFAYRNFGDVWEIGGVYTVEQARRHGYAQQVVQTALAVLGQHRRTPRYQVHEHNMPSIRLAERLGLVRFLTIEHFLYERPTRDT